MVVRTCTSKKYVLSSEEEEVLNHAMSILDDLYECSQKDSELEKDSHEASNGLSYLINKLEFNGKYSYWREEVAEDED